MLVKSRLFNPADLARPKMRLTVGLRLMWQLISITDMRVTFIRLSDTFSGLGDGAGDCYRAALPKRKLNIGSARRQMWRCRVRSTISKFILIFALRISVTDSTHCCIPIWPLSCALFYSTSSNSFFSHSTSFSKALTNACVNLQPTYLLSNVAHIASCPGCMLHEVREYYIV